MQKTSDEFYRQIDHAVADLYKMAGMAETPDHDLFGHPIPNKEEQLEFVFSLPVARHDMLVGAEVATIIDDFDAATYQPFMTPAKRAAIFSLTLTLAAIVPL